MRRTVAAGVAAVVIGYPAFCVLYDPVHREIDRTHPAAFGKISTACEKAIIQDVRAHSPMVRAFERLFPVQEYSARGADWEYVEWLAFGGVYCHYVLTMHASITWTDREKCHATLREPFQFDLDECGLRRDRDIAEFGIEEWNKVVAAGGDFSVIGLDLIKDQPLEACRERGFCGHVGDVDGRAEHEKAASSGGS